MYIHIYIYISIHTHYIYTYEASRPLDFCGRGRLLGRPSLLGRVATGTSSLLVRSLKHRLDLCLQRLVPSCLCGAVTPLDIEL